MPSSSGSEVESVVNDPYTNVRVHAALLPCCHVHVPSAKDSSETSAAWQIANTAADRMDSEGVDSEGAGTGLNAVVPASDVIVHGLGGGLEQILQELNHIANASAHKPRLSEQTLLSRMAWGCVLRGAAVRCLEVEAAQVTRSGHGTHFRMCRCCFSVAV